MLQEDGRATLSLVDLFAGCGGLSLGLEEAGFEPVFANELHPDAMATYLLNRQHTELARPENHVHDIHDLTRSEGELAALARRLANETGEVDLVVGGPPCQGYSGIGHRRSFSVEKAEVPSNHLYQEMVTVIKALKPRAFVFENVKGILTGRWTAGGEKGEIWEDVRSTFEGLTVRKDGTELSYRVGFELVLAKNYGVPQNRPRVLLVGLREDVPFSDSPTLPAGGLLPAPSGMTPDPVDLLGDLEDPMWQPGGVTGSYPSRPTNPTQRHLRRPLVGSADQGPRLTDHQYSKHSERVVAKFRHMIASGGEIPPEMKTKKFAQRVLPERWGAKGPTITATSLPDDYVHYSQPRVLTVREWARLQMFPDQYQFFGKRTTGGRRRAGDPSRGDWSRDLPKYTQIGNAVPVALAKSVGDHLRGLLSEQGGTQAGLVQAPDVATR